MLGNPTIEVTTTAEAIAESFAFAPDCKVEAVLPGANEALVRGVGRAACRLVAINGVAIGDSGELKHALSRAAAAHPNGPIQVSFGRVGDHAARVRIEDSVVFDGASSGVAEPDSGALRKMVQGITPRASSGQRGTPAETVAARVSFSAGTSAFARAVQPGADTTSSGVRSLSTASFSVTDSDASTVEFDTVRLNQMANVSESSYTSEQPAPGLLEFDKMRLSIRGEDSGSIPAERGVGETSIKSRLVRALDKASTGQPVICVVQDVNPIAEIELLALAQQKRIVGFDLSVKLRLRPKPEAFAEQFAEAMRTGAWFVVLNAHKSINMCTLFDELLADAKSHNWSGFDPRAKIIVTLEQHPHFPKRLIQDAVIVKMVSSFHGSSILSDSMATSSSRNRLVRADALSISHRGSAEEALKGAGVAVQKPAKRRVRINAAVEIVDIAPREVVKARRRDNPIDVSGSVALVKTFSGVPNDTFLCVNTAGEPGRFAVGSSCGNVYFLDSLGNSLLQAHTHEGAIWDVAFNDKFHFATGCEDGTCATWSVTAGEEADGAMLVPTSATALGADVYSVGYLKNMAASPLLIGGLHNNLVIRPPASEVVEFVPLPSNTQVIDSLPSSSTALIGGGDGSVCVVDVERAKALHVLTEHSRKIPSLAVRDDNQFFTGSFDCCILSWDLRVPGGVTSAQDTTANNGVSAHTAHTLQLRNFVTGLDVDDVHLAASVGENLYLWDVRKLNTVLGGYPQAWKGLSRGIKVQSMDHLVVTASPDGFARFWNFV